MEHIKEQESIKHFDAVLNTLVQGGSPEIKALQNEWFVLVEKLNTNYQTKYNDEKVFGIVVAVVVAALSISLIICVIAVLVKSSK